MIRVSAILLAAGLSHRMGRDKLLLPYRGKTLLRRAADLLAGLPVAEKILVTTEARHILMQGLTLAEEIVTVINAHPELGQSESVKLGVMAASGDSYLFLAADQPGLGPDGLAFLLEGARAHPDKIIYPTVGGVPRSPCLFPSRLRPELLALSGDSGGRVLRDKYPADCLPLEAKQPEAFFDVDTPEDYERTKE